MSSTLDHPTNEAPITTGTPPRATKRKKEDHHHHYPSTSSSPPSSSSSSVLIQPSPQNDPSSSLYQTKHNLPSNSSMQTAPSSPPTRKVRVKREKSGNKTKETAKESIAKSTTTTNPAEPLTSYINNKAPVKAPEEIITTQIQTNMAEILKTPEALRREKRMKLVNEFMSSELLHVEALKTVVVDYVQPLRLILPKETIKKLFGNIEVIMGWNIQFYGRLRARYEESEDVSMDSSAAEDHEFLFGDIMVEMLVILRQIYSQYNENYEEAQLTYRECMKNKDFEQFVMTASKGNSKFSLLTLLYLPVGRMIIYDALLKEIIQITPPGHPDREDLVNAQKMIGAATRQASRVVDMRKNLHNVLRIQSLLLNAADIAEPHRRYVYEGTVIFEAGPKNFKEREMFLFNDLLIIAKPKKKKFEVEWSYKLSEIQLIDDDEDDRSRFKLKDAAGNELLLASEEKPTWMYHIKSAIKNIGATPQELHALRIEEERIEEDLGAEKIEKQIEINENAKYNDPQYFISTILEWSEMSPDKLSQEVKTMAEKLKTFMKNKS